MSVMAKKKPTRKPGRPRVHPDRVFLQTRVPGPVKEAFQQLARRNHRAIGDELLLIIENHMRANGCWPEQSPAQDD